MLIYDLVLLRHWKNNIFNSDDKAYCIKQDMGHRLLSRAALSLLVYRSQRLEEKRALELYKIGKNDCC